MRLGLAACAVLLSALPARGDNALLTPRVLSALTSIDSLPSASGLSDAFTSPTVAMANLEAISLDPAVDLGIRIRALRALAAYCAPGAPPCGQGTAVHQTLAQVIGDYRKLAQPSPQDLMLARAAVETIGESRAVLASDVAPLLALLAEPSRDVRATVVRALRSSCDPQVTDAIKGLQNTEPSPQVRVAIQSALQAFERCVPN
jgi:HEAT repeat protein